MKKIFMVSLLFFTTSQAFAIADDKLIRICWDKGTEKIISQSKAWGCEVTPGQIEAQDVDNRWYNPSKYIWYQAIIPCNGYDRVIKLVQYYNGRCF